MSAAFIVDSSVAMSWLFKDEVTPATERILDRLDSETALVPALWYLELTNVMALAERSGRITAAASEHFVLQLSQLQFDVDTESPQRAFSHVLPLCRAHRLTSYDALYLDLAIRRHLPLATLDEPLRKAAKKLGVKLLGK
jgi:predicted nucleic acid-binding protein